MRASLDKDGLYCLAFAEQLDYEMGEQLFQFLQVMMKEGLYFPFTITIKSLAL